VEKFYVVSSKQLSRSCKFKISWWTKLFQSESCTYMRIWFECCSSGCDWRESWN